jgi:signal transduction histidine kinase
MKPPTRFTTRGGLASRLLAGQTIVLIAGALTTGLVAALLGPSIFHQHLLEAGHTENSPELVHIEMAYRDASFLALGTGLTISLLAAGIVTWLLTRRIRTPLANLTHGARELSRGHYATRVTATGSGTELDTLADAFNVMAERLQGIEDTRRRMLADLAHELRTPITTLTAYHDGLHDGVASLGPGIPGSPGRADRPARPPRRGHRRGLHRRRRPAQPPTRSARPSPTCSGTPAKPSATPTATPASTSPSTPPARQDSPSTSTGNASARS